jgi:uncharacterized membrane protein YeiB
VKVLAVAIIVVALVIIIVPQFTNCEYGKESAAAPAMDMSSTGSSTAVTYASMEETPEAMSSAEPMATPAATGMVAKMKCYWSAHAEIVAGVPLIAIGVLLFFARRKETTRVLGVLTAVLGVLTMLIPTTLIGTCLNDQMVCNTEMKPTLLITGGITIALGVAVLVLGEMKRENGGSGPVAAA